MKMKDFITEKKWHLISGILFLAIFTLVTGVLINSIIIKLDSIQKQNKLFASGVEAIEASSAALNGSIDDLAQNMGADPEYQSLIRNLESDLESILSKLSELSAAGNGNEELMSLKASIDKLNKILKNMESGAKPVTTVPDSSLPGNPAPSATVKKGQEITVIIHAGAVSDMYGYQFNLNYDKNKVSYKSGLRSSINGISTIFKKDNPDNLLIGATMIGDKPGYSGKNVDVCTLVFTAKADIDPSTFSISQVNTVDSAQKYVENISGWSIAVKAQ